MSIRSRKIKFGYLFRVARPHQKKGLYFENVFDWPYSGKRISDTDVVAIRDFLSRYINKHLKGKDDGTTTSIRLHARAIQRDANSLEAK